MPIDREHQDHRRRALIELLAERPMSRQIEIGRVVAQAGIQGDAVECQPRLAGPRHRAPEGVYRPPVPKGDEKSIGKIEEFILRVNTAGPYMLVFDTSPGTAKAVAVALKNAAWPEVRGIMAEDETLFVATDNVYDSRLADAATQEDRQGFLRPVEAEG